MSEKCVDDCWNVDGDRELSDMRTGFPRFTILSEKPPDGCTWSGGRLTRKQTISKPDKLWPEVWKHMSDASKRKEKHKWAIEKPELDNAASSSAFFTHKRPRGNLPQYWDTQDQRCLLSKLTNR